MTEERPSSSISVLHSMLNRLKSSERPQGSSHVTAQHCRYSKETNQCGSVFIAESDKPEWNFAESNPSEFSVKPERQNDSDVHSEYFTRRTGFQESSPTTNIFLKSRPPANFSHNFRHDARQDLQPRERNLSWEKMKEEQTSQAESSSSILKNNPPRGLFIHNPTGSSFLNSEPRFFEGANVPAEYEIMKQPRWTENTVTAVENAEPPPLPPKQRNLNRMHVQLQRTFTLKDFKLDLEPINLLEEICTGEEWAKFLPVKDSPPETDAKAYSQTEDSHDSNDDIGSQNAVMKPDLSADKEQSEIPSRPASITDSQVDRVIQVRDETSDAALLKTPVRHIIEPQRISDEPEYEQFKGDENDLVVRYAYDKNDLKKDTPLDLSVVKPSRVLDNSALKSRIQLSKKRKHRPPGKRKKGNKQMASPEPFQSSPSSHAPFFASSKFYTLPCSESNTHEYSQTAAPGNGKALLQRISETPEFYSNDHDIKEVSMIYKNDQPSNKANLMEVPLDFSAVKSSGLLDNSALKNRIQLSKKRKHRPPGKRKNENTKTKFPFINLNRQRNTSAESFQPHPSSNPSVFTSTAFHNDTNGSHTAVPGNEKPKIKDRLLKPKLWKIKS
ncbi:uncharacterized protein si:dkey-9i23.6 isoform X1 [Hemibagrus wyckioides]|nr:uncharacterized protein si:dkey-9i23.6 isoform X1 [Hemibagrus wyckioides]